MPKMIEKSTIVLENARLTTTEAIFLFYEREGLTMGRAFETPEAVRIGNVVRNEVDRYSRKHVF